MWSVVGWVKREFSSSGGQNDWSLSVLKKFSARGPGRALYSQVFGAAADFR
jgi:hypothetical protein